MLQRPSTLPNPDKPVYKARKLAKIKPSAEEVYNRELCILCGCSAIWEDFQDDLSRKEYMISLMCQNCQDELFGG